MEKKLDCGCGPRPQVGYDAYTDIYMHPNVANNPEVKSKFVLAPMENMSMFKDKEFDFAYSHHVIEHVNNPDKACSELVRIAKSGVLFFPSVQACLTFGRADHNWLVFPDYEKKHILFVRKKAKSLMIPKQVPKEVRCWCPLQQKPFEWEGSFTWTVVQ